MCRDRACSRRAEPRCTGRRRPHRARRAPRAIHLRRGRGARRRSRRPHSRFSRVRDPAQMSASSCLRRTRPHPLSRPRRNPQPRDAPRRASHHPPAKSQTAHRDSHCGAADNRKRPQRPDAASDCPRAHRKRLRAARQPRVEGRETARERNRSEMLNSSDENLPRIANVDDPSALIAEPARFRNHSALNSRYQYSTES